MQRYTRFAAWYDVMSAEPVYRVGRQAAIAAMALTRGQRVLDVGCGSGLNIPALAEAVGPTGLVVGVDRSPQMLAVARRKADRLGLAQVRLVQADATRLVAADVLAGGETPVSREDCGFDAMIVTYALSLMSDAGAAWRAIQEVLAPGARVAVVDMQPPTGAATLAAPIARLACWLGGADIEAQPWQNVEADLRDVRQLSLRGGHVQVRIGRWAGGSGTEIESQTG